VLRYGCDLMMWQEGETQLCAGFQQRQGVGSPLANNPCPPLPFKPSSTLKVLKSGGWHGGSNVTKSPRMLLGLMSVLDKGHLAQR
jgi:hypothetical protein